jgi:GxxExxY protein
MNRKGAEAAEQRFLPEPSPELTELSRKVIGAAIEVHRYLGPGYLEVAYESALAVEFELREIPFRRQFPVSLTYKGIVVGAQRLDFLVDEQLVVEIKSSDSLAPVHRAQVMAYLKAGDYQLGLLINFNVELLSQGIRRVIWSA